MVESTTDPPRTRKGDRPLAGKVAVVTGASRGIGRGIAERCVLDGARVVVTGRNGDALTAVVQELGPEVAEGLVVDAGERTAAQRCVDAALHRFGRLDVVVNNAAFVPTPATLVEVDDDVASLAWETNVGGPLRLVRAAWDSWMREHGGTVLNMGSLGGISLQADTGLYNVTKAALHHLTRMLAAELGPTVRVNGIAPGLIRTDGSRHGWERVEEKIATRSPMGRIGEVTDVVALAAFLIGPDTSWMTGETVTLDGGALVQTGRRSPSAARPEPECEESGRDRAPRA